MAKAKFPGKLPRHLATNRHRIVTKYVDVQQDAAMLTARAITQGWKAYTSVFGSSDEEDSGFEGFPPKVVLNEPRRNDTPEEEEKEKANRISSSQHNSLCVQIDAPVFTENTGSTEIDPLASEGYLTDLTTMPETPNSVAFSPHNECLTAAESLSKEENTSLETSDSLAMSPTCVSQENALKLSSGPHPGDGKMKRIVARYTASITGSKKRDKEKIRLKMEKLLKAHWAGRLPTTTDAPSLIAGQSEVTSPVPGVVAKPVAVKEESGSGEESKSASCTDSILRKPRLQLNQKLLKQLRAPARLQRFSQQIQEQAHPHPPGGGATTAAAAPAASNHFTTIASPALPSPFPVKEAEGNMTIAFSHPAGCAFVCGDTSSSSSSVSGNAEEGSKGNPGTVVCGICGVVRKYSFVLQAKKFGTFACEPCRKFISRTLRNRIPVTCSKNTGDCILVPGVQWTGQEPYMELVETPDNLPAKYKCKACWLKMALLGFRMKDEDHDALRLLLPRAMHSRVPDAAHRSHFTSDAPHKGEIIKLSRTNSLTLKDPKLSTAIVVLEDAKFVSQAPKRKTRVKRGKEDTPAPVVKSSLPEGQENPTKEKPQLVANEPASVVVNSARSSSCPRGPRIKHVCRSASAVLGPPKATFPAKHVPETPLGDKSCDDSCLGCEKRPVKTCEEVMLADKVEVMERLRSQSPVIGCQQGTRSCTSGESNCITPVSVDHDARKEDGDRIEWREEESGAEESAAEELQHGKPDRNKLWEQGLCVVTSLSRTSYLPEHLCYLCGSAGKDELVMCLSCCETFHPYCPEEKDMLPSVCGRCQPSGACRGCNLSVTSSSLQCLSCASWVHETCAGITQEQLRVFNYMEKSFLCSQCFPEGNWATLWRDLLREFVQLLQDLLPNFHAQDLELDNVTSLGALYRLLETVWQGHSHDDLERTFRSVFPFFETTNTPVLERLKLSERSSTDEDSRTCVLCPRKGDQSPSLEGRLLYIGSDQWIHVNCCVWSQHVLEEEGGAVQDLPAALLYAKHTTCKSCKAKGASVACALKPCSSVYHFACAVQTSCTFTASRKVYCPDHAPLQPLSDPPLNSLAVDRYVYVDRSDRIPIAPLHEIQAVVGSLRIKHLGALSAVSDHEQVLVPVQFRCTRQYWSVTRPGTVTAYHLVTKYMSGAHGGLAYHAGLETTIDHTQDLDIDSTTLGDMEADAIMSESGLNIPGMESQEDKELIHMVLQDMDFEQELVDSASRYQQHKEDDYSQLALEQLLADPSHAMALLNSLPPEDDEPAVKAADMDLKVPAGTEAGTGAAGANAKDRKLDQNSNVTLRVRSPLKRPQPAPAVGARQVVSVKVTTGVPVPLWLEADSTSETDVEKLKPILQLDGAMDSDSDVEFVGMDTPKRTQGQLGAGGESEPVKCAKCKRCYRTAASFAKHEQTCSFEPSGSDTEDEDGNHANTSNNNNNNSNTAVSTVLYTPHQSPSFAPPTRLTIPVAQPTVVQPKTTPIPIAPAPPELSSAAAQSKYAKLIKVKPPRKRPAKRQVASPYAFTAAPTSAVLTRPLMNPVVPMYNPMYFSQSGLVMSSAPTVAPPMLVLPPPPTPPVSGPGNNTHYQSASLNNGNPSSAAQPVLQYLGALPSDMLVPTFTTSVLNFPPALNNNFLYLSTNTVPYDNAPAPPPPQSTAATATFTLTPTQGPDGQVTFVLTQAPPPPPSLVINPTPNLNVNMQPYAQPLVIPVNPLPQPQLYLTPPTPLPPTATTPLPPHLHNPVPNAALNQVSAPVTTPVPVPPPTPVPATPTPLSILPLPVVILPEESNTTRPCQASQVSPDSASLVSPKSPGLASQPVGVAEKSSPLLPSLATPVTVLSHTDSLQALQKMVVAQGEEHESKLGVVNDSQEEKAQLDSQMEIEARLLETLGVEVPPPPEQENNVTSSTTPLPTYSYRKAMAAQGKKGRSTVPRVFTPPLESMDEIVEEEEPTVPVREPDSSEPSLVSPNVSVVPEPQPSVNPVSFSLKTRLSIPDARKPKTSPVGPHIVYELTSDDGFSLSSPSLVDLWQELVLAVQKARSDHKLSPLSTTVLPGDKAWSLLGLTHNTLQYLLEQLPGASKCVNFKFRHHAPEWEEPSTGPAQGCARAVPFVSRSPQDMFGWLASKHRLVPQPIPSAYLEGAVETTNKRFTTVDLPLAMRYRQLKENGKEKVGVYRSPIHGRGLFSKRDIEAGEMVIEYAGQLVRSSLTDKREKMYQAKGIGCYMFRIDEQTVVDATVHGNAARFINHSCEPNCYSRIVDIFGKKHILIFALRRILRGEELTYDYKFPIEEDKIPCSCGATKCRKYLN